jgi:hypothetical protein
MSRSDHAKKWRWQLQYGPARHKNLGRLLIFAGAVLVIAGIVVILAERLGIHFGSLPGDIRLQGRRGSFYFPVVSCLVISALLSFVAWLINRH